MDKLGISITAEQDLFATTCQHIRHGFNARLFASLALLLMIASGGPAGAARIDERPAPAASAVAGTAVDATAAPPVDPWTATLERAAPSVVSLEVAAERSFTDNRRGLSTATGFVVDAERGIILTNRHVVGSGPISASATFQNQERVPVWPLYRDPVHDFGFLRYDPAALRHARPRALALRPDKVRKGLAIRVIGSDGGEQLSILAGTIARTDRPAPHYGRYNYNDFNTFYLQAASGTSGGSSGSPVIDLAGDAVALNAGANRSTASSFFLPLSRVERALRLLQRDEAVSRGTLDVLWHHQPYRELRRLGLDAAREDTLRSADGRHFGRLVARQVLPGGVADGALLEGDILLAVDGVPVADFADLAAPLDARVGQRLRLSLLRQGRELHPEVTVGDLHARQPEMLLELGGGVLHAVDLQRARAMHRPRRGLLLAEPGYLFARAGVPRGALLSHLDGRPLESLQQLIERLGETQPGARWLLRYRLPGEEHSARVAQIRIDERWFDSRLCRRRDDSRRWDCRRVALAKAADSADTETAGADARRGDSGDRALAAQQSAARGVEAVLLRVEFDVPHPLDNVHARHFKGSGLLLDPAAGLVAVDRNTVPVALGDAEVTLFGTLSLPAEVVFLHPRHNVALLRFDPAAVPGELPVAPHIEPAPLDGGEVLRLVALRDDGSLLRRPVQRPVAHTLELPRPRLPRFSQVPLDTWALPDAPPSLGGALLDADGALRGLWTSFAYEGEDGITEGEWLLPAALLQEALSLYREGRPLHALQARLGYLSLARARQLGLPDDWLRRLAAAGNGAPRALLLQATAAGSAAAEALLPGDLLLAIDGRPVARLREAEQLADRAEVALTLLRDGAVIERRVHNPALATSGERRLLHVAGAYLQAPPRQMALQRGMAPRGIYVGWVAPGSPAHRDGLYRNLLLTAVDGVEVESLDELQRTLRAAGGSDGILRLSLMDLSGRRKVIGLQPEALFWPTFELYREAGEWRRRAL